MLSFRHMIPGIALALAFSTTQVEAMVPNEPTWAKSIIPMGQERAVVKSTPIEQRPYRPLHVYGNTVRRRYYHGTAIPLPRTLNNSNTK